MAPSLCVWPPFHTAMRWKQEGLLCCGHFCSIGLIIFSGPVCRKKEGQQPPARSRDTPWPQFWTCQIYWFSFIHEKKIHNFTRCPHLSRSCFESTAEWSPWVDTFEMQPKWTFSNQKASRWVVTAWSPQLKADANMHLRRGSERDLEKHREVCCGRAKTWRIWLLS